LRKERQRALSPSFFHIAYPIAIPVVAGSFPDVKIGL
jgi:hypothetical protein